MDITDLHTIHPDEREPAIINDQEFDYQTEPGIIKAIELALIRHVMVEIRFHLSCLDSNDHKRVFDTYDTLEALIEQMYDRYAGPDGVPQYLSMATRGHHDAYRARWQSKFGDLDERRRAVGGEDQ